MRITKLIPISYLLIFGLKGFSQDVQFTQFYANPLYISPSFTVGMVGYRVTANYRNQWNISTRNIQYF
jgi:hypothetical protein